MSSTTSGAALGISDIVGIVIGGVLGLTTIIGIIISVYALCCKKDKAGQVWPQEQHPNQYYPPTGPYGQPTNTGYYAQPPPTWNKQPTNNNNNNNINNNNEQPPTYSSVYPGSNPYGKY